MLIYYSYRTDRDDMGGVGNFNRDNRTLYVGGLKNTRADIEVEYLRPYNHHQLNTFHFSKRCIASLVNMAR